MATETQPARDETAALTRSQLLIWTGQRLQPDDPLYNMVLSFRIRGRLDPTLFAQAFQSVFDRSDALRATFSGEGGTPRQIFHEHVDGRTEFVDLSAEADAEQALSAWQTAHATRPFDMGARLTESALLKLAEDDFVWFLNQHHLITDAWSTSLIYRNVQACYTLAREGRLADADATPSFRDYIDYEARQRSAKSFKRAHAYWRKRLAMPPVPSTFYRPTPAERSGRTARVPCPPGAARSARIKALARQDGFRAITPDLAQFQIFATVLFAWLYRISGNRRLAIGTPSHSRGSAKQRQTVGLFIEIYPLQVDVEGEETFASLYAKVAERSRGLLVNATAGASGFEHHRAFDVVLNYITAQFGEFDGKPMRSEWIHAGHGDRNHLLRLQVEDFDRADAFGLFFDVNVDTFDGDERELAGRHFLRLLDAMLDAPDARIDTIGLIDEAERAALTTVTEPATAPPEASVVELFARQATATPDAVALAGGSERVTYGQLAARVSALAKTLCDAGVTPGQRVAIALPCSSDAVSAIFAVLSIGATYVPVDVGNPRERIAFILRDAGVVVTLTARAHVERLPDGARSIKMDDLGRGASPTAVAAPADLDATAYVIYTSGSTGQPKGVEISHRSLANYIGWAAAYYLDGQSLAWALFSSLAFDLTVTSIFVPLTSGGRVVIYAEDPERREITIQRVVEDNAVDIIKLTPAHLALIQPMDLSTSRLKKLIVGGEDFKTDLARAISQYFGDRIDIYNEYGPTEATVACMIHRYDPATDRGASVPIGRPIDRARIIVLDAHGELQPRGVIGELTIGGLCVAKGYLNRVELTAERFVDDPFAPGAKMYRSGDLARWNPDGTLAYLGRSDFQIKINGVRIEPGETEAALVAQAEISAALVRLVERHSAGEETGYCRRCGIDARHPNAKLDAHDVCGLCRVFEDEREAAMAYFGTLEDLRRIVTEAKAARPGQQDCIALLSGGKDSTYALCQLVDLGLTPLVFTLDNGFISDGAKANIRRVVEQLGLELVIATTPAMNAIFADSLKRFSNVCNGCFKTIYTLSMNLARERGIRYIGTGLSRGQIFETRVANLFHQRVFDPATIDNTIIEARKAYHRADDAVSRHLDVKIFADDAVFGDIQFIDFYRYCDVSLDEVLAYLKERVSWVRPADTGRSTNCLINEAGIYVHKKERGYHNYALPYSWDVRLGHKERDAAREELDDRIDVDRVNRILGEVGYALDDSAVSAGRMRLLTGYYVAPAPLDVGVLKKRLAATLPDEFIPTHFVHMESLPLTANGKIDRAALPEPDSARPQLAEAYAAPNGAVESTLAKIWADILGIDRVGANDNFFDLGGDSILNIQIVARAKTMGLAIQPQQIFDHPTVGALAKVAGDSGGIVAETGPVTGDVAPTPIQKQFFARRLPEPWHYNQAVLLEAAAAPDALVLEETLRQLVVHHDALRSRFVDNGGGWQQTLGGSGAVTLERVDLSALPAAEYHQAVAAHGAVLHASLDLDKGELLRAALIERGAGRPAQLLLVIHHLVIDGVSWWILLDDLDNAYRQLAAGTAVTLPAKTTSIKRWSEALAEYAASAELLAEVDTWCDLNASAAPFPADYTDRGDNDFDAEQSVSVELGEADTRALLVDVAARWRSQAPDVIVSALARTLCAFSGQRMLQLELEGHGREDIRPGLDLLRTVGWFTSTYPVVFDGGEPDDDLGELLLRTKKRLRAVPARGIGFGVLRHLANASLRDKMAALPEADVLFNYLGQWDRAAQDGSFFTLAKPVMASFGRRGQRRHRLEVNAVVFDRRLRIDLTFSRNLYAVTTVDGLVRRLRENLVALIHHVPAAGRALLTPSDFPEADLNQGELDDILADFGDEE